MAESKKKQTFFERLTKVGDRVIGVADTVMDKGDKILDVLGSAEEKLYDAFGLPPPDMDDLPKTHSPTLDLEAVLKQRKIKQKQLRENLNAIGNTFETFLSQVNEYESLISSSEKTHRERAKTMLRPYLELQEGITGIISYLDSLDTNKPETKDVIENTKQGLDYILDPLTNIIKEKESLRDKLPEFIKKGIKNLETAKKIAKQAYDFISLTAASRTRNYEKIAKLKENLEDKNNRLTELIKTYKADTKTVGTNDSNYYQPFFEGMNGIEAMLSGIYKINSIDTKIKQEISYKIIGIICQCQELLKLNGIFPLAVPGEAFDPKKHDAKAYVISNQPKGTILEVFRQGYAHENDIIIYDCWVSVSSGPDQ